MNELVGERYTEEGMLKNMLKTQSNRARQGEGKPTAFSISFPLLPAFSTHWRYYARTQQLRKGLERGRSGWGFFAMLIHTRASSPSWCCSVQENGNCKKQRTGRERQHGVMEMTTVQVGSRHRMWAFSAGPYWHGLAWMMFVIDWLFLLGRLLGTNEPSFLSRVYRLLIYFSLVCNGLWKYIAIEP